MVNACGRRARSRKNNGILRGSGLRYHASECGLRKSRPNMLLLPAVDKLMFAGMTQCPTRRWICDDVSFCHEANGKRQYGQEDNHSSSRRTSKGTCQVLAAQLGLDSKPSAFQIQYTRDSYIRTPSTVKLLHISKPFFGLTERISTRILYIFSRT